MYSSQKHIDGEWFTSDHIYKGHKVQIKMRKGKGCKIHIWNLEGTKIVKTFRYNFSTPTQLLKVAQKWIDKI